MVLAFMMTLTGISAYVAATDLRGIMSYAGTADVSADQEMRGMWVSMYDYPSYKTTDPGALMVMTDNILNNCKDMGINAIFLQVRPYGDAIYPSAIFPWSQTITGTQGLAPSGGFDPLEYWVDEAHARGMQLHAWINPYRVTKQVNDLASAGLASTNPALGAYAPYVVEHNGSFYYDPGQPAVNELVIQGALEIVNNYDVDGIHLDDYFYPGTDFNDAATFATYGAGYSDIGAWRINNVNNLISQLDSRLHAADPDIRFGVSTTGIWANAKSTPGGSDTRGLEHLHSRYADSVTWIRNGWLDYIAPQIYWQRGYELADFNTVFNWWADICAGTGVKYYVGMADYRAAEATAKGDTSSPWYGTSEIRAQLDMIKNSSVAEGSIHFRYAQMQNTADIRSLYCSYYSTPSSAQTPSDSPAENPVTVPDPVTPEEPSTGVITQPEPVPETPSAGSSIFPDIAGNWAESYITALAKDNIISGMEDGTFRPFAPVTRAQFVKLLAGVAGADTNRSAASLGFDDVTDSDWYAGCVAWALSSGVASGTGDATFDPDAVITREQMAKMIMSFASSQGISLPSGSAAIDFADAGSISGWAADYVNSAVKAGIINGSDVKDAEGATVRVFNPLGTATRAEASKVISKVRDASRK